MKFLAVALLLLSSSVFAEEPRHTYSPLIDTQSFNIGLDLGTIKILKISGVPTLIIDIDLQLADGLKTKTGELINRFQNKLALDCINERQVIISSVGYTPEGKKIFSSTSPIQLQSGPPGTPISEIKDHLCPLLLKSLSDADVPPKADMSTTTLKQYPI
jgi:hypothetical protein